MTNKSRRDDQAPAGPRPLGQELGERFRVGSGLRKMDPREGTDRHLGSSDTPSFSGWSASLLPQHAAQLTVEVVGPQVVRA